MNSVIFSPLFFILTIILLISAFCTGSPSDPLAAGQDTVSTAAFVNTSIILTGIPDVRQAEYYSCGAASLQAVLSYYGINSFETDLRTMLNTSMSHGTYSWDIESVARQMGFSAKWKENVSFTDVESAIKQGNPVIVRSQRVIAPNSTWADTQGIGHYMVIIGFDNQYVYLEDPYILGSRLRMSRDDFIDSWHTYVTEIPPPPGATTHYHETVFIQGMVPATHEEFIGPSKTHSVVQPVAAQPPILKDIVG